MTVKLYVEGGGTSSEIRRECRKGFRIYLEKAGFKGCMPRIVACGPRQDALDRFRTALDSGERALLLVDSETAVAPDMSPWSHLTGQPEERFARPRNAGDLDCHLMVVCMESWFLADKEALSAFFGQGFNPGVLPQRSEIEAVPKADVYAGLRNATANCKAARYEKGRHSFRILERICPKKVARASHWAKRFLDALDAATQSRQVP